MHQVVSCSREIKHTQLSRTVRSKKSSLCTYFPEHFLPKETSEINAYLIEIIKHAEIEDAV